MKPHEELLLEGKVVKFEDHMGRAAFVSHQWLCSGNPDPELSQFASLQGALRNILASKKKQIDPEISTELQTLFQQQTPFQQHILVEDFRSKPLFIWYDYFSIPQEPDGSYSRRLGSRTSEMGSCASESMDKAIRSISAYIARCHFFFVLYPVVENPDRTRLFGPTTWASRGWCLLEKTLRELLPKRSYIVIKSAQHFEAIDAPTVSFLIGGCPAEGLFGVEEDKMTLGEVLAKFLKLIIWHHLQNGNLLAYRTYLNFQLLKLRGFPIDTSAEAKMFHPIPYSQPEGQRLSISAAFMYQNGFKKLTEYDSCGWSPMCYAAFRGDPRVLESLLEARGNPSDATKKAHPLVGSSEGLPLLSISSYAGHKECVRLLISARAKLDDGYNPPLFAAAMGKQPECVRMLCQARASLQATALGGIPCLPVAAMTGGVEVIWELLAQSRTVSLSNALSLAMYYQGGTAEMVSQLVTARADVNEKVHLPWYSLFGLTFGIQSIQYRLGARRMAVRLGYHSLGATPLHFAIISGHYEAAASLLVARATLEVNARKVSALDLARELGVPQFLMDGFDGDLTDCNRIVRTATDRYFSI